jgi:hypothetical protein
MALHSFKASSDPYLFMNADEAVLLIFMFYSYALPCKLFFLSLLVHVELKLASYVYQATSMFNKIIQFAKATQYDKQSSVMSGYNDY